MEVRKDSQNGTPVASPTDTIGAFQVQTGLIPKRGTLLALKNSEFSR